MLYKYLSPGSSFIKYSEKDQYDASVLRGATVVTIGRGFDERIIGWIVTEK